MDILQTQKYNHVAENGKKIFVTPDQLRKDSYELGSRIINSGFIPDFIVALWRGGATIGCYIHELFKYCNHDVDHIAIRTSRYTGIEKARQFVSVHNLEYLEKRVSKTSKILLVDDIFDSGNTMKAVFDELENKLGEGKMPMEIKVATVYYKPKRNETNREPNYYVNETDNWIVFPHELEELTMDEIRNYMGQEINDIIGATKMKEPVASR
jgi:uncharacterized protein